MLKTALFSFLIALAATTAAAQTPGAVGREALPPPSSDPAPPSPTGTTAAARTPVRTSATPALTDDYRIGPGDQLRIEVYKDPQLSQSLQVRPDGKITLPLVGDLRASGLTPIELRDQLTTALKEYVTSPTVTVIVTQAVPPVVFVMGEVVAPGTVPITPNMTVLQALAMAGGFKDFAKTGDIRILRPTGGSNRLIEFDYKDASRGEGSSVVLQPGDTIVVP